MRTVENQRVETTSRKMKGPLVMGLLQPERCALVTVQDSLRQLPWARIFDNASAMLNASRRDGFDAVFSDFGLLADGCCGSRLTRALVGRQPRLRVYLLSGQPDLHARWARTCGATGVLARDMAGLAQVMSVPLDEASIVVRKFVPTPTCI
jgi:hypothetical protein